jgi:hypothetical protein
MPRAQGVQVNNTFVKGLITENTALAFPKDACTDVLNVDFDITGAISKRRAIDVESNYKAWTTEDVAEEAVTEFVWKTVNGDGDRTFFVQQKGRYLYFTNVSDRTDVSNIFYPRATIDLNSYIPSGSNLDPAKYPCQYAYGNGDMIVVNRACRPLYVTFIPSSDVISASATTIQIRDFRGLNDGLALTDRPTSTVANLISTNPQHYYNLLNQGWVGGDALTQWDTARSDLPSNADSVALYRSSETDAFDDALVTANTGYNSPAAKGHYILDAFAPDRTLSGTLTFAGTVSLSSYISPSGLTTIGSTFTNSTFAFNSFTNVARTGCATSTDEATAWLGKTLSAGTRISKVAVYGSADVGFCYYEGTDRDDGSAGGGFGSAAAITLHLYGKAGAAPANRTDGTLLGTSNFSDFPNMSGGPQILSTDTTTTYDHVWVNFTWHNPGAPVGATPTLAVAEIEFYEYETTTIASTDDIFTYERPSTVEFYAGRIFYAGMNEQNLGSNIYFTQILEKREQAGYCYQKSDPTSETVSDLLPDDGGLIKIPNAGTITRLKEYQGALIVQATNGVWLIQGSAGAPFVATDYEVRKISSAACDSPLSTTDARGTPFWWGVEGIHTIQYDPNYSSFTVTTISDSTIQTVIDAIPSHNKKYVKGCCDTEENIVYWLYNDSDPLDSADRYRYPKMVTLDLGNGAFSLYEVGGTPDIRGISWVQNSSNSTTPSQIKFTISYPLEGREEITFADFDEDVATDWIDYATRIESKINISALTKLEDATSNETAAYDGTTAQTAAASVTKTSATSIYYGATLGTARPITRAIVWGSSDQGYVNGANPTITMHLYGKTGAAPANGTDGTVLGEFIFTDTTGESKFREILSGDVGSTWDHVWVRIAQSGGAASMYIAEVEFYTYAADAAQESDYDAYFITGYSLDGQAMMFFQPNYVIVYSETVEDSSCFLQGIFDFTNDDSSGKWSTPQQIYNDGLLVRDVNYRRLKVRGKGRAMQLKFYGEAGLPFKIIGWGTWITSNAGL